MSLSPRRLRSAIIPAPLTASPDTPVLEVIAQMGYERSRHLATPADLIQAIQEPESSALDRPTLHPEARSICVVILEAGELIGILTERDVVRLCAQQKTLEGLSVRQVMTHPVISLKESSFTDLFAIMTLLQQHHIHHLPILNDQDHLVGVVTYDSLRQIFQPIHLLRLHTVAEVMVREVICAPPDCSMLALAQQMIDHEISSIVIVEPGGTPQTPWQIPIGIITQRDIVQAQSQGLNLADYSATAMMSTPMVEVKSDTDLWQVLQVMENQQIHRLVVTGEHNELVGIVTQSSVLKALTPLGLYELAEGLDAKVTRLEAEKVDLFASRTVELEHQVQLRTKALQIKAEQEKLVAQIAYRIRSSFDVQEVLAVCCEELQAFLGCDRILVYQFQPDWSGIIVAESVNPDWPSALGNVIHDSCFQQQTTSLYSQDQPIGVNNINTSGYADCHIQLLEQYQVKSNLVAPIRVAGQLWGLLIGHQCDRYREWQADEIRLLQDLSVQLAIALQQATTYHQLQTELQERRKAEDQLATQNTLLAQIAQDIPLLDVLQDIIKAVESTLSGALCSVLFLDQDNRLRHGAAPSLPTDYIQVVDGAPVGEGIGSCGTAVFRRETVIVADIATDILWQDYKDVALAYGLRACWSSPILASDGRVLGTFGVYYPTVRSPQIYELDLIVQMSNIAGIAIERQQAALALKQSEAKSRAILDAVPDLMFRVGADGVYRGVVTPNRKLDLLSHIDKTTGQSMMDILPNDLAERQWHNLQLALQTGEVQSYEQQVQIGDQLHEEEVRVVKSGEDEVLFMVRNISDRKRAENALRKTETLFREAQRIAQMGNWELNLVTNTLYWSEEVFRIFELDPQQFAASYEAFLQAIHPDDRDRVNQAHSESLNDRQPYNITHRLLMSDGRIKYVHEQCETLYAEDGTPILSQGTVQDITIQHIAELERAQAEEALRQVIEGTAAVTGEQFFPELVNRIAQALGVRYASVSQSTPNGLEVLAFCVDGKLQPTEFLPSCSVPCCLQSLQKGECYYPHSLQTEYPDNPLFIQLQAESYLGIGLRNAAGEPIGNLCILHDQPLANPDWARTLLRIFAVRTGAELERCQTAQALQQLTIELEQRVEERTAQLREREAQLQDFFDSANDLIQSVRLADGRFEYVNRAWRDTLGYSAADLQDLTFFDVLHPNCQEHCRQAIAEMQSGTIHKISQVELSFVTKTQQEIIVEGSVNCRLEQGVPVATRAIFRDITERKRAEQQLQDREARYRALMDGASDAIILANQQGYLLEANHKAETLLGYTRIELTSMHFTQLHQPEELPRMIAAFEGLSEHRFFQVLDINFLCKDGHTVPVDVSASVIEINGEKIVQGIFRDITERKQAEQALQESQQFLRTVLDTFPLSVFWKNRDSVFLGCNQQFATTYNLQSTDDVVGKTDFEVLPIHAEAMNYVLEDHAVIASGQAQLGVESQMTLVTGEQKWIETNKLPLKDWAGNIIGIVATFQDITARKQAEAELAKSRQQYYSLIQSVNGVVWEYDLITNRFTFVSNKAEELLGYPLETWLTEPDFWRNHVYADDLAEAESCFTAAIESGKSCELEYRMVAADGSLVWVYDISSASSDETSSPTVSSGVLIDISDRKQIELALQDSETRFRRMFDSNVVGMLFASFQGDIVDANDRFLQMVGYTREELEAGAIHWNAMTPPEHIPADVFAINQLTQHGFIPPWEKEYYRKDGSRLPVLIGAATLPGNEDQTICVVLDISDRKRAERIIQQQAERERLLREITQRIRQSLDLQTIFDTACQEIRQVIKADRVGIFKFHPNANHTDGEFVAESVVSGLSSVMGIRVHDHCFGKDYADLYAQGKFFAVTDIHKDGLSDCHSAILRQFQVRATLVVPLLCGNQLWGLLCVHQCVTPHHWTQPEIDAVQQLATQLAIAIQQANLYDQIQSELQVRQEAEHEIARQLQRQQTLGAIVQRIRESLDIDEILSTVTHQVKDIFRCDRVIVFRLFPDGRSQIVDEAVSPGLPVLKNSQWADETWSPEILNYYWQGNPRIIPDVMQDTWTDCLVEYSIEGQIQSKIVAPILQDTRSSENHRWVAPGETNKLWGILVVHACQEKRIWHQAEAQLLQQIANQLAIAIQQAGLFEQAQQELSERQQAQLQLTERNQQLAISNEELARATRLKDEFLANMSHELRTPLNAILGMTEGLHDQILGSVNDRQIKALQTIERSGLHLLELINDILDVAKIESGQIDLDCLPTAVAPLCQSSLAFIKQQALKKRIQLELSLPPDDLPDLLVDERRIRQVLINLLNNAVKFTPDRGRITLKVSHLPGSIDRSEPAFIQIAVIDTGIGIAPENINKLFQPFIQIDSALNRQYQGTGLGLALVKRIVELHGGQVGLTSEVGVGSCFTIELPCTEPVGEKKLSDNLILSNLEPQVPVAPSPDTTTSHHLAPPLILLAEDNEANINTLSSYLQAKGYRMVLAQNGQQAVDLAQSVSPDLILMDIQMPGMDGLEAMQQIRQTPNLDTVPIIALTALAMPGDRDRCLSAGANDYLSKPVKLKQLSNTIQHFLMTLDAIPDNNDK